MHCSFFFRFVGISFLLFLVVHQVESITSADTVGRNPAATGDYSDENLFGNRTPPPKSAPPLTPPEQRKQLAARSTGVACGAAVSSIALKRSKKVKSIKGKLFVVAAVVVTYYLSEHVTQAILEKVDLFDKNDDAINDYSIPEPTTSYGEVPPTSSDDTNNHHHHQNDSSIWEDYDNDNNIMGATTVADSDHGNKVRPEPHHDNNNNNNNFSTRRKSKKTIQATDHHDNPDIWVDDVDPEPLTTKKSLSQKLFFWRREDPEPEVRERPIAPKWSNFEKGKKNYEQNFGL